MLPNLVGKTVFLLGGGPSLIDDDSIGLLEEHLGDENSHNRFIIAINESIYVALYADLLFFRDSSWYLANREIVDAWNGIVVTTSPYRWYTCRDIIIMKMKHSNDFLIGDDVIKYGRSGGHIALSLAISLGARKCVLLGYDCRVVYDSDLGKMRSHFHDKVTGAIALTYSDYFLPAWKGWGEAARRAGVEVVNATPKSAIVEFPYRPLCEVL